MRNCRGLMKRKPEGIKESEPAKVESEQPKAERIGGVGAANVI